jgi:hypothetical protein
MFEVTIKDTETGSERFLTISKGTVECMREEADEAGILTAPASEYRDIDIVYSHMLWSCTAE